MNHSLVQDPGSLATTLTGMGLDQGELNTVIGVGLDTVATFTGAVGKMLLRHAAVTGNMWFYPLGFLFTGVIDPAFDATAYSFAAASIAEADPMRTSGPAAAPEQGTRIASLPPGRDCSTA